MYSKITDHIKVSVFPAYLEDESCPEDNEYIWSYTVQVENMRSDKVQLVSRYWNITDANGRIQEVEGQGVVGEHPELEPGQAFQYTSGTVLKAPSGIMVGNYEMESESGKRFNIDIPAFSLDSPYEMVQLN